MENAKSQTPQTARLGRKIRKMRERKKGGKRAWKDVCKLLNIMKKDGQPDTGLAYKIAYEGYEPLGRDLRKSLGLRDICTKCKRLFRVVTVKPARAKSPARVWWDKLKGEDRQKIMEWAYSNYLNWKKTQGG